MAHTLARVAWFGTEAPEGDLSLMQWWTSGTGLGVPEGGLSYTRLDVCAKGIYRGS